MAQKKGQWLIQKRQSKDIWHQLHEFFLIETESLVDPNSILSSTVFTEVFPGTNKLVSISDSHRQQLTHQTIHAVFINIQPSKVKVPDNHFWADESAFRKLAFPRLINHYLQKEKEEGKSW
jgi:A/G-specific adenine glycosylase